MGYLYLLQKLATKTFSPIQPKIRQLTTYYNQPPFYGRYTGQPMLVGTSSNELENFVGAKFYCPYVLADGNQRIWIREKTLEFFSTVLSTLSRYLKLTKY